MNVLIAPNAFKHSISSMDAGAAILAGLNESKLGGVFKVIPIADGGDGSLIVLAQVLEADIFRKQVKGPLGEMVEARYGFNANTSIGIVELAEASGIRYLTPAELNPSLANTFGTGQIIHELLEKGCRHIYLTVGGSASVDGGTGILSALGMAFYNQDQQIENVRPKDLKKITRVENSKVLELSKKCKFTILSDVENVLLGSLGAVSTFGPQKGIVPGRAPEFESAMTHWAGILNGFTSIDIMKLVGGGASGGVPAGLFPFLDVEIKSGGKEILELVGFHDELKKADLVITTEGRIDAQTGQGKGPGLVAKYGRQSGKAVMGLCGSVSSDYDPMSSYFTCVFSINQKMEDIEVAITNTKENLKSTALELGNLLASQTS